MKINKTNYLIIFILFASCIFAQKGNYLLKNYSPADYSSTDQNRGIVQDKDGRIFAANLSGVLNYDGEYWKHLVLPHESAALSVQTDKNGLLFVGGQGEFGFVEYQKNGAFCYRSLVSQLKENERKFNAGWSINCFNNEVYFGSNESLILFRNTLGFLASTYRAGNLLL